MSPHSDKKIYLTFELLIIQVCMYINILNRFLQVVKKKNAYDRAIFIVIKIGE